MTSASIAVICHFEDDPDKVALAELIEAALYEHPDVASSEITRSENRDAYVIDFVFEGQPRRVLYAVESTVERMDMVLDNHGADRRDCILYILDMSLGEDRSGGIAIFRALMRQGVAHDRIWFLSAYAVEVVRQLEELGPKVEVISKPPDYASMADHVLEILL